MFKLQLIFKPCSVKYYTSVTVGVSQAAPVVASRLASGLSLGGLEVRESHSPTATRSSGSHLQPCNKLIILILKAHNDFKTLNVLQVHFTVYMSHHLHSALRTSTVH